MRIWFAIFVFAIAFSGYVVASEAFAGDNCEIIHAADMAGDNGNADTQTDSSKNGICMDCHHSCTAHAAFSFISVMTMPMVVTAFYAPSDPDLKGRLLFSFLRPPKTLV